MPQKPQNRPEKVNILVALPVRSLPCSDQLGLPNYQKISALRIGNDAFASIPIPFLSGFPPKLNLYCLFT